LDSGHDIQGVIENDRELWIKLLTEHYQATGFKFADRIILDSRGFDEDVVAEIDGYLEQEAVILQELSHIEATTVSQIIAQVDTALIDGLAIQEIQQALDDIGLFGPVRSLRISRTVTGAAASIGQLASGSLSGASFKTWQTSGLNVRDAHSMRDGETVGINDRFSVQLGSSVGPRFPGDPEISAADRINCRCSLTFA